MILSLLRVRDFKVEDMMRSSFSEFASQQQFPEVKRKLEQADRMLADLTSKPWPEGCALECLQLTRLCTPSLLVAKSFTTQVHKRCRGHGMPASLCAP